MPETKNCVGKHRTGGFTKANDAVAIVESLGKQQKADVIDNFHALPQAAAVNDVVLHVR